MNLECDIYKKILFEMIISQIFQILSFMNTLKELVSLFIHKGL